MIKLGNDQSLVVGGCLCDIVGVYIIVANVEATNKACVGASWGGLCLVKDVIWYWCAYASWW